LQREKLGLGLSHRAARAGAAEHQVVEVPLQDRRRLDVVPQLRARAGGLSGVVLNLVQGSAFSDTTLSAAGSRNQAVLGIALALAVTIVGIIRIELYHRRLAHPPSQEEEADWKVEPPEIAGRR